MVIICHPTKFLFRLSRKPPVITHMDGTPKSSPLSVSTQKYRAVYIPDIFGTFQSVSWFLGQLMRWDASSQNCFGIFESLKIENVTMFSSAWVHVRRAQEIEIHLSFVLPSVLHPSVSELSLYLLRGCLSNFSCCFPWAYTLRLFFLIFWKEKDNIFGFLTNIFSFL